MKIKTIILTLLGFSVSFAIWHFVLKVKYSNKDFDQHCDAFNAIDINQIVEVPLPMTANNQDIDSSVNEQITTLLVKTTNKLIDKNTPVRFNLDENFKSLLISLPKNTTFDNTRIYLYKTLQTNKESPKDETIIMNIKLNAPTTTTTTTTITKIPMQINDKIINIPKKEIKNKLTIMRKPNHFKVQYANALVQMDKNLPDADIRSIYLYNPNDDMYVSLR